MTSQSIKFYQVNKPYGYFSNFAAYPISLKEKSWATTEHYYQAQKFVGTKYEEEVRQAPTPCAAAEMGRDRNKPLRPDWETVKCKIMKEALYAKFTQHSQLTEWLLQTGDQELIEHTKNDNYWGDGGDGTGLNMLGQLLMSIRELLQSPHCPECHQLTLKHNNYVTPANSYVGEQDLTETICLSCGWSEWE